MDRESSVPPLTAQAQGAERRTAIKLYPLFCGYEICDIGVSLRGRSGFLFAAPIGAFLVETETGYVLVDSGSNEEIIWDPERCPVYYNSFRHPVIRPGDTLLEQLASVGVSPSQVTDVIITHMHADHAGG